MENHVLVEVHEEAPPIAINDRPTSTLICISSLFDLRFNVSFG
jgi:hypothetical protein